MPDSAGVSNVDEQQPADDAGRERDSAKTTRRWDARELASRYGLLVVLVVVVAVFSILLPSVYPTFRDFKGIVNSEAIVLLLALALTVVLRTGDFDLSVAAMMTVTAALSTELIKHGAGIGVVLIVALIAGVIVGTVNGFLVVRLGVSSFIVTLGMMTALGGIAYAITDSNVVLGIGGPVLGIVRDNFLGIPLLTWYGWALVVVLWYVYERTPVGRYMLFVGGSPDSAKLAGLPVARIRMGAFIGASVISSFTGILLAGYLAGIDPSVGPGYLLPPFVGAFLSPTVFILGRFNAFGTLVGLYLLAAVTTGLQLEGGAPWVTSVVNGVALVVAVTAARLAGQVRGQ